jgi:hypothetical protein
VPLCAGLDRDPPGDQVAGFTWPHDVRKMAAGEAVQARVGDASGKFAAGAGRYDWIPAPDHHERGAIDRIQPWPGVEAERNLALDTMPRQVQSRPPKIRAPSPKRPSAAGTLKGRHTRRMCWAPRSPSRRQRARPSRGRHAKIAGYQPKADKRIRPRTRAG